MISDNSISMRPNWVCSGGSLGIDAVRRIRNSFITLIACDSKGGPSAHGEVFDPDSVLFVSSTDADTGTNKVATQMNIAMIAPSPCASGHLLDWLLRVRPFCREILLLPTRSFEPLWATPNLRELLFSAFEDLLEVSSLLRW